MRNATPWGAIIGAMIANGMNRKRRNRVLTQARELTEVEKWNAEVEAKKAAKKARRASGEKQG